MYLNYSETHIITFMQFGVISYSYKVSYICLFSLAARIAVIKNIHAKTCGTTNMYKLKVYVYLKFKSRTHQYMSFFTG